MLPVVVVTQSDRWYVKRAIVHYFVSGALDSSCSLLFVVSSAFVTRSSCCLALGAYFVVDELVVPGEVLLGLVDGSRGVEVVAMLLLLLVLLMLLLLVVVSGESLLLVVQVTSGGGGGTVRRAQRGTSLSARGRAHAVAVTLLRIMMMVVVVVVR